jgi:hypothetical protein
MNNLLGFAPDLPTTTPGIILDCINWIPYESGMRAGEYPVAYASALAAECLGAATLTKLDTTRRVFAGTASKLYELNGTSWTDRSRGGNYTLGATTRWSFTQFGDTSIASNIDTTIQTSSSGAFGDQATAPKAAIVESVLSSGGGFVLAFNTIDATYGTRGDGWWCCAVNDVTNWTPSVAVQCATGRLLGNEGPIVAARKFGSDRIVAYKSNSIYAGTYVGGQTIWAWEETPGYGVVGLDAVANLGINGHFCVGEDDIYIFDGSRPNPVTKDLRKWFVENCSGTYRNRTIVTYDRDKQLVWIFFPSAASSTGRPDTTLVYHLVTGQWGRADQSIEAALIFNTPSDTFDTGSGTFDADTGTFDSASPGSKLLAIFNTSHVLSTMTGEPSYSSFTLHDIGDDVQVSRCTGVLLRYMSLPTASWITPSSTMATAMTQRAGTFHNAYDVPSNGLNKFPVRQTARWHRMTLNFTGNCKVSAYQIDLQPAGKR